MKYKKSNNKLIIAAVILGVFLAIGLVGYWYTTRPKPTSSLQASESTKQQTEAKDAENAKSTDNKNYQQQPGQAQQVSSNTGVSITSIGQSGSTVYVNALVDGETSGTCTLTLTNGSKKIVKSAAIGYQVSYYICNGFNISSSEFAPKGDWTAQINISGPKGSASSEERKVTVQ
ncbi:MAG: hypothetical protein NT114_01235 [Patescibacteria group bacterium]|nr:hypothetical protein [Patescibacteria group bacterium]